MSCTRFELVSTSLPVSLHFVSWWGKSALCHRMFPLLNFVLTGNMTYRCTLVATRVPDALEVAYDHVRESLHRTTARRKQLYDIKAVNRKFRVGSWVLRYYPPAAQHKLWSPWIGPNQVIRQATGHARGIQKNLLYLYTWTIWNCVRARKTSNGILAFLLLNHCALSDRALMSVTLHQHRPWMCPRRIWEDMDSHHSHRVGPPSWSHRKCFICMLHQKHRLSGQ